MSLADLEVARGWRSRTWRLERYLANNPRTPPTPDGSGKG